MRLAHKGRKESKALRGNPETPAHRVRRENQGRKVRKGKREWM